MGYPEVPCSLSLLPGSAESAVASQATFQAFSLEALFFQAGFLLPPLSRDSSSFSRELTLLTNLPSGSPTEPYRSFPCSSLCSLQFPIPNCVLSSLFMRLRCSPYYHWMPLVPPPRAKKQLIMTQVGLTAKSLMSQGLLAHKGTSSLLQAQNG